MLGHSHALSGFTVGAATLPLVPAATFPEQAAWVAAVGGFAMLPDLDTGGISTRSLIPRLHGSSVALMWGPVTCLAAEGVSKIAGGHRNGTHSALGVTILGALAMVASLWFWTALLFLALAIGLALKSLAFAIPGKVEETWITNLALSFGSAWWLLTSGDGSPVWLPVAVFLGCVVHVCGDMLTYGGVPLLWLPFNLGGKGRQALGLFKTGAGVERYLLAPAFLIGACVLLWQQTGVEAPDLLALLENPAR